MKRLFFIVTALVLAGLAMAQSHAKKKDVHNDLLAERNKRHAVARDLAYGNVHKASADHRAAVMYHKEARQDLRQIHRQHMRQARRHHIYRRHRVYFRHPVHHRRYIHHKRRRHH